jgi:hypothetical protein
VRCGHRCPLGSRQVLDSAARDTLAVATALRAGGFVVMVREDVNGADLRSALKEYRERMQPDGVGFIYLTGLGAQVDGQNLLLPRNTRLDADASAAAVAAQVKASGVPLQEVVEALMSTPESARLLVVDAAYNHPALAKLPRPGLAEQRLPPGMLALFSQALAAAQDVPAIAALPTPAPKDPREIAGSRFARVLVGTLVTPRISAGDALRNTHKALVDGAPDQAPPWLGGKSDNKEDLAEASLLDGLFPRTPEELAREALKQITRAAVRDGSGSGATAAAPAGAPSPVSAPSPALPAGPRVPELPAGGGSALGSVTSTVSTVASAAGSVATVAAGAATVAVGTQALVAATGTVATAATAATAATTTAAAAVSTAGSVAGSVVGGTARILSTTTGEQSARQAVQTTLARSPGGQRGDHGHGLRSARRCHGRSNIGRPRGHHGRGNDGNPSGDNRRSRGGCAGRRSCTRCACCGGRRRGRASSGAGRCRCCLVGGGACRRSRARAHGGRPGGGRAGGRVFLDAIVRTHSAGWRPGGQRHAPRTRGPCTGHRHGQPHHQRPHQHRRQPSRQHHPQPAGRPHPARRPGR